MAKYDTKPNLKLTESFLADDGAAQILPAASHPSGIIELTS